MRLLIESLHEFVGTVSWNIVVGIREPAVPFWRNTISVVANAEHVVSVLHPSSLVWVKTVEIFIVAIAKLISADVLSVILVATDRVRMHHSLVSSEIGLEQSLLLNQVPELPGGKLIGHPCPKSHV